MPVNRPAFDRLVQCCFSMMISSQAIPISFAASSIFSSEMATAVPLLSRSAAMIKKSPTAAGTRNPSATATEGSGGDLPHTHAAALRTSLGVWPHGSTGVALMESFDDWSAAGALHRHHPGSLRTDQLQRRT